MADDTKSGMPAGQRHVYGPRALGALVPAVTRAAFRRRAPATAQVLTDWAAIVGPALADLTLPRRLQGGTLSVSCAGPIAMELQHLTTELLARINGHLGRPIVERLRFVQDADFSKKPAPEPAEVRAGVAQAAEAAVSGVPPGELRDALASLGRAVIPARPRSSGPLRPSDSRKR